MEADRPRILIVDDDVGTRRTLELILERQGFAAETAATGREALGKAERGAFSAALLDVRLPDMQGTELLEPLKAGHPDMEVVMVTGYASTETAIRALNKGAAAYITKPLNVDDVLAELRRILEKQRLLAEKREAQEALREREAQYRSLFEGVAIGLYRTTPNGQILDANQAMVDMLAYPDRAALLKANARELYLDPGHRELEKDLLAKDGMVRGFETQMRRHDGSVIWVRDTAHVRRTVEGHPIAYEGSLEDVTRRKRALQALQESEQRYRAVFETTGTATVIIEEDTTLSLVNAEFEALSGYTRDEVEGMKSWTEFVAPEDLERMRTYHQARRRDADAAPTRYEFQFVDRHGAVKNILISINVIPGTNKSVASLLDITRRKRTEQATRAQLRHIEALLEIDRAISSTLDLDRVLALVLEKLGEVIAYDSASVFLVSEGIATVAASRGHPDPQAAGAVTLSVEGDALAHEMLDRQQPLVLSDAQADERFLNLGGTDYVRSWIGVPLIAQDEPVGFLTIDHRETGAFDEESAAKASSFAHQAAVAIQNAQLFEQAEREVAQRERAEAELAQTVQELRLVNETIVAASRMTDRRAICRLVARRIQSANPHALVTAFLLDPAAGGYTVHAVEGLGDDPEKLSKALGGDPRALTFASDGGKTITNLAASGRLKPVPGGVTSLAGEDLPGSACQAVDELLGAPDVYIVGFASADQLEGGIALFVPRESQVRYPSALETIGSQVSVVIERQRAQNALRQSQAVLSATQSLMHVGGWVWDVEQERMHWTEETYRIHGLDPAEFAPGSSEHIARSLACYDPEDRPRIKAAFERCAQEGAPYDLEFPITTTGGDRKWIRTVANPVTRNDRVIRVIGSFADITEQRELEQQLRQQERIAAVGRMAGGIAHDFRNFLTTIILYAGFGLRDEGTPPVTQEALETIVSEAQKASDLVQQIMDFSGRSVPETRAVDLVTLITEVSNLLRRTLPEAIRVRLDIEPEMCVTEVDPTRIQQMLMNLALNARDAMPDGGQLQIALSSLALSSGDTPPAVEMEPGEWVHLTVSDTGTGMTEEVMTHLFEPFFTTKELGQGTGLGLAQVYGIVQQHGGAIDVDSDVGEGSSFHIYLPKRDPAHTEQPETKASVAEGRGEAVLLVEDEERLRDAGRQILSGLGYQVRTAAHGREALALLDDIGPDVVVTDIVMPTMGGKELMREISLRAPSVPVLAITGYTMKEEMEQLKELGFDDVLQKPFDARALAQAVRRALAKS